MFYALYKTATGELTSVGTVIVSPLPSGLSKKLIGAVPPDLSKVEWDPALKDFAPIPPQPKIISRFEFRQKLTQAERVALDNMSENTTLAAADRQRVVSMMQDLGAANYIKMNDPILIAGLNYLESLGLLGAGRANTILGV